MIDIAGLLISAIVAVACPECSAAHARALNNDVAATAPRANGNSAPSAPVLATRWGAVATGNGAMGVAEMFASREAAERKAMQDCRESAPSGGADCAVKVAYFNQCAAIAWGDEGNIWARGPDLAETEAEAFSSCSSKTTNCVLLYSSCSYPARVG